MNSSVVFASIFIGDIFAGFSRGRALSGVGFSAIYRAKATRLLAITRGGFLFSCKIGTGGVGRGRFFLAAEWHWGGRMGCGGWRLAFASRLTSTDSRFLSCAARRVRWAGGQEWSFRRRLASAARRVSLASRWLAFAARRLASASRRLASAARRLASAARRVGWAGWREWSFRAARVLRRPAADVRRGARLVFR